MWVLLPADLVPEPWQQRATSVALVPLLPEECARLLTTQELLPGVPPDSEPLLHELAKGSTTAAIAQAVGVSPRTVERRLAELRRRLGLESKKDLEQYLANAGF